jgi:hypothetical protein
MKIVNAYHRMTIFNQSSAEVRTQESRASRHNDCGLLGFANGIVAIVEMKIFSHLLLS